MSRCRKVYAKKAYKTDKIHKFDKIIMKNMKFYGYHGVLPEERIKGQVFFINVEIYTDLSRAGNTDNLDDTVNYAEVYSRIKYITENNKFNLIEKLAEVIAQTILNYNNNIKKVKVLVKKPYAPIEGEFDWMGAEIERERQREKQREKQRERQRARESSRGRESEMEQCAHLFREDKNGI